MWDSGDCVGPISEPVDTPTMTRSEQKLNNIYSVVKESDDDPTENESGSEGNTDAKLKGLLVN